MNEDKLSEKILLLEEGIKKLRREIDENRSNDRIEFNTELEKVRNDINKKLWSSLGI